MDFPTLKNRVQQRLTQFHSLREQETRLRKEVQSLKQLQEARQLVSEIIKNTAQRIQTNAHQQIAAVVTDCLQSIWGYGVRFGIVFEQKRNKTETSFVIYDQFQNEIDPLSDGGGLIDVVSFALRLCCLVMTIPAKRRLLLLDEPFKHLSIEHREAIAQLLERLARDLEIQFVLVTHWQDLQLGKIIQL